jgi:hypothetical protein
MDRHRSILRLAAAFGGRGALAGRHMLHACGCLDFVPILTPGATIA